MKLHTRILVGLAAGVADRRRGAQQFRRWLPVVEWIEPVGTIFIRLITMVVMPLVIASLFVGVASLGDIRRLGRIGGRTLAYFLVTTVLAAVIGTTVALAGRRRDRTRSRGARLDRRPLRCGRATGRVGGVSAVPTFVQTLVGMVPQNPIAAAAQGDLLAVIFAVVVFGAAATTLTEEQRRPLVSFFGCGQRRVDGRDSVADAAGAVAVGILIAVTVLRSGLDLLWSLATYAMIVIVGARGCTSCSC